MSMNLKGRDFLKLLDYTPEEIEYLVDLAAELKAKKKAGEPVDVLRGKNVALIFEKTSTRTRCSFEVAAHDLGMGTTYLEPASSQIGKKESIADTARVLGRMFDGIEYRGYGQEIVEELAKYAGVPVWNGLTNEFHPTQMLADIMTYKVDLGVKLRKAYQENDKEALSQIIINIPYIIDKLDEFNRLFRKQWFQEFKQFGYDVIDGRLGYLRNRILTAEDLVKRYLNGEITELL